MRGARSSSCGRRNGGRWASPKYGPSLPLRNPVLTRDAEPGMGALRSPRARATYSALQVCRTTTISHHRLTNNADDRSTTSRPCTDVLQELRANQETTGLIADALLVHELSPHVMRLPRDTYILCFFCARHVSHNDDMIMAEVNGLLASSLFRSSEKACNIL